MIRQGNLRGHKVRYPDGVGVCIWYPFSMVSGSEEDEEVGLCFDLSEEDLDDAIGLLQQLKAAEAEVFVDDGE